MPNLRTNAAGHTPVTTDRPISIGQFVEKLGGNRVGLTHPPFPGLANGQAVRVQLDLTDRDDKAFYEYLQKIESYELSQTSRPHGRWAKAALLYRAATGENLMIPLDTKLNGPIETARAYNAVGEVYDVLLQSFINTGNLEHHGGTLRDRLKGFVTALNQTITDQGGGQVDTQFVAQLRDTLLVKPDRMIGAYPWKMFDQFDPVLGAWRPSTTEYAMNAPPPRVSAFEAGAADPKDQSRFLFRAQNDFENQLTLIRTLASSGGPRDAGRFVEAEYALFTNLSRLGHNYKSQTLPAALGISDVDREDILAATGAELRALVRQAAQRVGFGSASSSQHLRQSISDTGGMIDLGSEGWRAALSAELDVRIEDGNRGDVVALLRGLSAKQIKSFAEWRFQKKGALTGDAALEALQKELEPHVSTSFWSFTFGGEDIILQDLLSDHNRSGGLSMAAQVLLYADHTWLGSANKAGMRALLDRLNHPDQFKQLATELKKFEAFNDEWSSLEDFVADNLGEGRFSRRFAFMANARRLPGGAIHPADEAAFELAEFAETGDFGLLAMATVNLPPSIMEDAVRQASNKLSKAFGGRDVKQALMERADSDPGREAIALLLGGLVPEVRFRNDPRAVHDAKARRAQFLALRIQSAHECDLRGPEELQLLTSMIAPSRAFAPGDDPAADAAALDRARRYQGSAPWDPVIEEVCYMLRGDEITDRRLEAIKSAEKSDGYETCTTEAQRRYYLFRAEHEASAAYAFEGLKKGIRGNYAFATSERAEAVQVARGATSGFGGASPAMVALQLRNFINRGQSDQAVAYLLEVENTFAGIDGGERARDAVRRQIRFALSSMLQSQHGSDDENALIWQYEVSGGRITGVGGAVAELGTVELDNGEVIPPLVATYLETGHMPVRNALHLANDELIAPETLKVILQRSSPLERVIAAQRYANDVGEGGTRSPTDSPFLDALRELEVAGVNLAFYGMVKPFERGTLQHHIEMALFNGRLDGDLNGWSEADDDDLAAEETLMLDDSLRGMNRWFGDAAPMRNEFDHAYDGAQFRFGAAYRALVAGVTTAPAAAIRSFQAVGAATERMNPDAVSMLVDSLAASPEAMQRELGQRTEDTKGPWLRRTLVDLLGPTRVALVNAQLDIVETHDAVQREVWTEAVAIALADKKRGKGIQNLARDLANRDPDRLVAMLREQGVALVDVYRAMGRVQHTPSAARMVDAYERYEHAIMHYIREGESAVDLMADVVEAATVAATSMTGLPVWAAALAAGSAKGSVRYFGGSSTTKTILGAARAASSVVLLDAIGQLDYIKDAPFQDRVTHLTRWAKAGAGFGLISGFTSESNIDVFTGDWDFRKAGRSAFTQMFVGAALGTIEAVLHGPEGADAAPAPVDPGGEPPVRPGTGGGGAGGPTGTTVAPPVQTGTGGGVPGGPIGNPGGGGGGGPVNPGTGGGGAGTLNPGGGQPPPPA